MSIPAKYKNERGEFFARAFFEDHASKAARLLKPLFIPQKEKTSAFIL